MKCELCGEPMPKGEEMFKYHGYSGPCPAPPLPQSAPVENIETKLARLTEENQRLRAALARLLKVAGDYMCQPRMSCYLSKDAWRADSDIRGQALLEVIEEIEALK